MSRILSVVALAVVFGSASPSRAEVAVGSSIEWLTYTSDVVLTGRIEKIVTTAPAKNDPPYVFHEITFAVDEVVKGKAEARIVIHYRSGQLAGDTVLAAGVRSLEPMLFFLTRDKQGKLVPTHAEPVDPIFDLAHPVKFAFDARGKALFAKEAILNICRDTERRVTDHLKRYSNGRVVEKRVDVGNTAAGELLYAGSAVYLRVPDFKIEGK